MATDLISTLRERLREPGYIREHEFEVLQQLARIVNERSSDRDVHELVLRALDQRAAFVRTGEVLDMLARNQGLYPYLDTDSLSFADQLAYEFHRPMNLDDDAIVFHRVQAEVYRALLAGENVILSAPTSFGKSLLIDAMVATGRYREIAVVVPTLALIDETRRRLVSRFGNNYKVITHASQTREERNIYVLTQERVIDFPNFDSVDFFVIDEFYKLDPRSDLERGILLNQAFYRLNKTGAQFYLLGPNIRSIPDLFEDQFECRFIRTDYATVVSELTRIKSNRENKAEKLVELCRGLLEPTLIYCASPASVRRVASQLLDREVGRRATAMNDAVRWISENYHPDWMLVEALRNGIGMHHARMPRSLSQFIVRAFNTGDLRFLICTSTLIEGVNTAAKNVVIYDHKISTKNIDFFTFNNIKGRSGRMFKHFIGRVFLFNDPPQEELPLVDIPVATQPDDTPTALLIQMDDDDLTLKSKERVSRLMDDDVLSVETLKANSGVAPEAQQRLARELRRSPARYHSMLRWTGMPTYEELEEVCVLIWNYLVPDNRRRAGVSSGRQLAFKISRFRTVRSIPALIREELRQAESADDAVEDVLEFIRYWPTFNLPRYMMAVDRIQREIFQSRGLRAGDYSVFAAQVENLFLPNGTVALEEYGIPIQLGARLVPSARQTESLDELIGLLRRVNVRNVTQSPFEADLLRDAQKYL